MAKVRIEAVVDCVMESRTDAHEAADIIWTTILEQVGGIGRFSFELNDDAGNHIVVVTDNGGG